MTEAAIQAALKKLPKLALRESQALKLPVEGRLPDTKTAQKALPFPPPRASQSTPSRTPSQGEGGPLRITHHAPEGEVPIAPKVSLHFSEPMVPLGRLDAVDRRPSPASISPAVPGRWRWLSTQDLVFEPEAERLPMATRFEVKVDPNTQTAAGQKLDTGLSWRFETPAPQLKASLPNADEVTNLTPLFLWIFDQAVDPEQVIAALEPSDPGLELRLATEAEILAASPWFRALQGQHPKAYQVALAVNAPLRPNQRYAIELKPGWKGLEGDKASQARHRLQFRTYPPLKLERANCWGDCGPEDSWNFDFNNALAEQSLKPGAVEVSPEPSDLEVEVMHGRLVMSGHFKAKTSYTVKLPATLRDVFGQSLGETQTVKLRTGAAPQVLVFGQRPMWVQSASAEKALSVWTLGVDRLEVRAWEVRPEDWPAFIQSVPRAFHERPKNLPWQHSPFAPQQAKLKVDPETMSESRIDLSSFFPRPTGHVVVEISLPNPPKGGFHPTRALFWLQRTDIGLDLAEDSQSLRVFASRLQDGSPLKGVRLQLLRHRGAEAETGEAGLARLPLPKDDATSVILAELGADHAFLPRSMHGWEPGWKAEPPSQPMRYFVFDDRGIYKPGETVRFKGWLRRRAGPGQITPPAAGKSLDWRVIGARGELLKQGLVELDRFGGFSLKVELPKDANLGTAQLKLIDSVTRHHHSFQIQSYRRPEFELTLQPLPEPLIQDETVELEARASYYTGGGLAGAPLHWHLALSTGRFQPPGWSDYQFGEDQPWWRHPSFGAEPDDAVFELQNQTSRTGEARVKLDMLRSETRTPMALSLEATAVDLNQQRISASEQWVLHPAAAYAGLRQTRRLGRAHQPLDLELVVVDIDGKPQTGLPVELVLSRQDPWKDRPGEEVDRQTLVSTGAPMKVALTPDREGSYLVLARVKDAKGRESQSELRSWVLDPSAPSQLFTPEGELQLALDQTVYAPGDTAELLIQLPFAKAEGRWFAVQGDIKREGRFSSEGASHVVKLPIEASDLPGLQLEVEAVGQDAQGQPAYAEGEIQLKVSRQHKRLQLTVKAKPEKAEPGQAIDLTLQLNDAKGRPLSHAQMAVLVVDEAVLALTGFQLSDPLEAFYPEEPSELRRTRLRSSLLRTQPGSDIEEESSILGRSALGGAGPRPKAMMMNAAAAENEADFALASRKEGASKGIQTRTSLLALAFYKASLGTNAKGEAKLRFTLPDTLSRFRVMAVAVDAKDQAGLGETSLTVQKPLMVRPSPPRFLSLADRFELPVILQNTTEKAQRVALLLQSNQAGDAVIGVEALIPPEDRSLIHLPMTAKHTGSLEIQLSAISPEHTDSVKQSLPVLTPATREAFAVYGSVENQRVLQPLLPPSDVFPEFGGLSIQLQSTQMGELSDALRYLEAWPFQSPEVQASRLLAIATLNPVLRQFQGSGWDPARADAQAEQLLRQLSESQNPDGGWGYWQRDASSRPFVSLHVAHALVVAKKSGQKLPKQVQSSALRYVKQVERQLDKRTPKEARTAILAYASHIKAQNGEPDAKEAEKLLKAAGGTAKAPLDVLGWLWAALPKDRHKALLKRLSNEAQLTAKSAHFVTHYEDGAHLLLHSQRRVDALLLLGLVQHAPQHALIEKLARGLLEGRQNGAWLNSQDNAWAILAMAAYFKNREAEPPRLKAEAWADQSLLLSTRFDGRSTESQEQALPMAYLQAEKPRQLLLASQGKGRLYYRIGLRYAPQDLAMPPEDRGFEVSRRYLAVEDPSDVKQETDGSWTIRHGALVKVELSLVNRLVQHHVLLKDALAAGLEAQNPALRTTETLPKDEPTMKGLPWWWIRPWFTHQALYDTHTEAYTAWLPAGVFSFTYYARATTPGVFTAKPAFAEALYEPERFGRSASAKVTVR